MGDVPAESDDFCILFAPKVAVAVRSFESYKKKNPYLNWFRKKAYVKPGQIADVKPGQRYHRFLWLLSDAFLFGRNSCIVTVRNESKYFQIDMIFLYLISM